MRYIHELTRAAGIDDSLLIRADRCPFKLNGRNRVNILALGDVGSTMLTGFRLLGGDVISEIGIMDIRPENTERLEMEINQIGYPFMQKELPPVYIRNEGNLFDCDVLIFCASRGVPPVGPGSTPPADVRMAQLDANREIIKHYADLACAAEYRGMIAIVSDPVDNLAAAFLDAAGLEAWQIQGYGLGVMNMRALYYSQRLEGEAFALYESEGRAFGPHGQDLVIANSIDNYDDEASRLLTKCASEANLRVRDLGFKPYIAPALSSAAISILLTLRGEWHYGSVYLGSRDHGAFLGVRNRMTADGTEYEDLALPDLLYERVLYAYERLCSIR